MRDRHGLERHKGARGAARVESEAKLREEDERALTGARAADETQLTPRGGEAKLVHGAEGGRSTTACQRRPVLLVYRDVRNEAEGAMRRMTRFGLAATGVLVIAGSAWAQPFAMPPGRWWERPRIAAELALTAEQRATLDTVSLAHAKTMVDLKGEVEKAELDVRVASDAEPFDAGRVREAFAALQQRRGRLELERFEMLLKVREVLSAEQWKKLTAIVKDALRREFREGIDDPQGPGRPLRPRRF
jgi:Spy/CpxP family protein refolding chaperone